MHGLPCTGRFSGLEGTSEKEEEEQDEGEPEEEEEEEVVLCTLASPSASGRPRESLCHGARAASEVVAGGGGQTRRSRRSRRRPGQRRSRQPRSGGRRRRGSRSQLSGRAARGDGTGRRCVRGAGRKRRHTLAQRREAEPLQRPVLAEGLRQQKEDLPGRRRRVPLAGPVIRKQSSAHLHGHGDAVEELALFASAVVYLVVTPRKLKGFRGVPRQPPHNTPLCRVLPAGARAENRNEDK